MTATPTPTDPTTCAYCGDPVWANRNGGWSSGNPATFVSIVCPGSARLHAAVAIGRDETDPCECGTVGCCVAHRADTPCETW